MARHLRIVSLILGAVLAMSAVAASAASAQGKLTSDGPVTLQGTQTGTASANALTAFGTSVDCAVATYTGHRWATTPHSLISSGEQVITVTPNYGQCTTTAGFGNFRATIDMNGCDYEFALSGTTGGVSGTYGIWTHIVCPKEKAIQVTAFINEAEHSKGKPFCTSTIVPFVGGYFGLHATNTASGHMDISGTLEGIKFEQGIPGGGFLCPETSTTDGRLHLDITVSGKNSIGGSTSVSVSD
jgi:hypothetical protein